MSFCAQKDKSDSVGIVDKNSFSGRVAAKSC